LPAAIRYLAPKRRCATPVHLPHRQVIIFKRTNFHAELKSSRNQRGRCWSISRCAVDWNDSFRFEPRRFAALWRTTAHGATRSLRCVAAKDRSPPASDGAEVERLSTKDLPLQFQATYSFHKLVELTSKNDFRLYPRQHSQSDPHSHLEQRRERMVGFASSCHGEGAHSCCPISWL
jgi:hypothetical protein